MPPIRNLSIRAKVALMGTILIVAFLILGASFLYSLNTVLQTNLLLGRSQVALRESSELLNSVLEMRSRLRDVLATGSPEHLKTYQSSHTEVLSHLANLRTSVSDPSLRRPIDRTSLEQIGRIDRAFRQWTSEIAEPFLRVNTPASEAALYRFLSLSEDQMKSIRDAVKAFQADQQRLNVERYARADQAASTASRIAFFGSGLTLLLVLLGFSVLSRSIMDPLFRLIEMGQAIASGDYSRRIPHPGQNELGRLAGAFNVMAENLETVRGEQAAIRSRLEALNRLAAYVSRSLHTRDRAEAVVMTLRRDFGAVGVQVWLPETNRGWICIEIHDDHPIEYRLYTQLPERFQNVAASRRSQQSTHEETGEVEWVSPLYRTDRINGILKIRFPGDQWNISEPLLSSINRFCTHAFELSRVYEEVSSERHRLDAILSSTGEGVLVVDRETRIALANPAALRVLDLENRPVLGLRLDEVLVGDGYTALREFIETTPADGRAPEESGALPFEDRFITATRAPVQDQGVTGTVVVVRDVTQQVEVDQMKSEFISIVSHELRTPLTSIKGSLGLLLGGAGGELPERTRSLLQIAQSNTDRLIRLINDILDISKIEAGRVEMSREPVNLAETIRKAVAETEGMASQEKVKLVVRLPDDPLVVTGDSDRLSQVIVNLISNAVKFSPPDSTVEVRAEVHHHVIEVDVIDEGPGIPLEHQTKLFQKFFQVDSSSARAKSGTGLGLAISNAIVKEHSGLMGVESHVGQGSRFWFTLPLARTLAEEQDQTAERARILLCQRSPGFTDRTAAMLERHGYHCDRARTGEEVLQLVKREDYDLLLLDFSLPDMGGLEVTRRVEAYPDTQDLPIAFLSSPHSASDTGRRITGWMNTPMNERQFQEALRGTLKFGRRKSDELMPEAAPLVLIVHDNPDLMERASSTVLATGMRVVAARSRDEALERIGEEVPNALILDLSVPGLNGPEIAEALRKSEPARNTPILVLAAQDLMVGGPEFPPPGTVRTRRPPASPLALMDSLRQLIQMDAFPLPLKREKETAPTGVSGTENDA